MIIELEWTTIVGIIYFIFQVIILVVVCCRTGDKCTECTFSHFLRWLKAIKDERGTFTPIIVQLYDSATDIAVQ